MKRFVCLTFLPLLAASVACGSVASDKEPVLATVHGELTNPQSLETPLDTRVAVVWLGYANGYSLAEDLQVQSVFPSQFKLELTHVPPAAAMVNKANQQKKSQDATPPGPPPDAPTPPPSPAPANSAGGAGGAAGGTGGQNIHATSEMAPSQWADDFGFAVGSVVAYEDLNHNGKLDLVDEGATAYVDRILGANPSTILVYFEGTIPGDFADEDGHLPKPGYNLFHMGQCAVEATNTGGAANGTPAPCTDRTLWLPIDTLYTLPMTGDPKFADIMCKSGGSFSGASSSGGGGGQATTGNNSASDTPPSSGSSSGGAGGPPSDATDGGLPSGDASAPPQSYPDPHDPLLQCAPDGKSFTYDCKPVTPRLCGDSISVSCGSIPAPPGPLPANWPCPVP